MKEQTARRTAKNETAASPSRSEDKNVRSVSDVLGEARLLRQRAAVLNHIASEIRTRFLPNEGGPPSPAYAVELSDAGIVEVDIDVVILLDVELAKEADRTLSRARSLLRTQVEVRRGPCETLFGAEPIPFDSAGTSAPEISDQVVPNPAHRKRGP